ncbi:MAG: glycosyltransferase [bacterium]
MEPAKSSKTVLICPLDWGIGHATRCVPIIRKFLEQGCRVLIASDRRPMAFLQREFPGLETIQFPGIRITYPPGSMMTLKMLLQGPGLLTGICKEHRFLKQLVRERQVDIVFSDNRFGLWSKEATCIFLTHQLQIMTPKYMRPVSTLLQRLNYAVIRRYSECWIPDFENHLGLAGELSHPPHLPANTHYIGTLSRFPGSAESLPSDEVPDFEILVLLSGPEPQRTILEEKILGQLQNTDLKAVIVRGITEKKEEHQFSRTIRIFSHLESAKLEQYIRKSLVVICRSGYSSIMDIAALGKRAIFIPTPGQTEQEYLARYLMARKIYFSMNQRDFDLIYALELSKNYPGMVLENDYRVLEERIAIHCHTLP